MTNLLLPARHKMMSVVCCCLLSISIVGADEKEPDSASDAKPAVTKIAGVLEAVKSSEVVVENEHLTDLEIKRIVSHGARVNKGQNIVWFDTEKFDDKIEQAEIDLKLAKLTLANEVFQHEQFLKVQKLDRAAAARSRKQAQQRFDNFVGVDRDREVLAAEFNLKSSQASLDNAMEELTQLEQMYKEDDLTEESEEIVLKRAKQSVDFAKYRLDGTKIASKRSISQSVPNKEASEKESLERSELKYEKTMKELETARAKQEIEMARKHTKFEEEEEKVAEMRDERKQMVLQAPHPGVVLHGKLTRGKLSDKPSVLEAGAKVAVDQVIATLVSPSPLQIRVDLDEKHVGLLKPGSQCKVVVSAYPESEFKGTVKSVSAVAYAGSKYDCVVTFRLGKSDLKLLPTMGCDLEFAAKTAANDEPKKKGIQTDATAKQKAAKQEKLKKEAGKKSDAEPDKPAK